MHEKLLVATRNPGKMAELRSMLADLPISLVSIDALGLTHEVEETGNTYRQNALKKAQAFFQASGLLTLADDSGLEIDVLDGLPGVRTARIGGPGLTPQQRCSLLLEKMRDVPWEKRTARFICSVALVGSGGYVRTTKGICEGIIAMEPAGERGFGYDPIFYIPDMGRTMAQLSPYEKHEISHRGLAVKAIRKVLRAIVEPNQ
jgi:XTP/dITP diphosphohydrolase